MEKLNHIADLLGDKFLLLNMVLLILFFFIICSSIKSRILKLSLSFIFSVFTTLQISSLFFVREFIDYSYIIHFNKRDVEGMLGLFSFEIILFFLSLLFFILLYLNADLITNSIVDFIKKRVLLIKKYLNKRVLKYIKITTAVLALFTMSLNNGVLDVSYSLLKSFRVSNDSFVDNLNKLGIEDYVKPEHLKVAKPGKNIIIISLESFEKGFLNDKYSHLTPYLRALKSDSDWSYYNMNENEGSKWTSGSLYTYLTGFPAFFGTYHNEIFQSSFHSNITGISHILKKVNYKTTHLSSNAKVSGTEDMLYALQVDNIIDKTQLKEKTQDKDLFDKAKQEINKNIKEGNPFALFIATLSTHFPNGIYDKRMEQYIAPKNSDLEFMVSAVDYLLKDFVNYLEEIDALDNTVIYIFPDHLKMGNDSLFNETGERGLYVLTNASEKDINISKKDTLYQIDLPKVILNGAEIKHNAKFLTDYIDGNKNDYIIDNISTITSLNVSGFSRTDVKPYIIPKKTEHYNQYKKDTNRFIAHAGGKIDNLIYTNSLEALNKSYADGFRLFELDIQKTTDGKYIAAHYWNEWADITNYKGETPVNHEEFLKYKIYGKYTPLDMTAINKWFSEHKDAVLVTDKINEPKAFSEMFIDKDRLVMELFSWEAIEEAVDANIKSAMPSQNIFNRFKNKNLIEKLNEKGITDIAISRNIIASNIDILKKLKQNNIRVYVYNVNDRIDRGEDYVVKYEMDYVYGLYADEWNFYK